MELVIEPVKQHRRQTLSTQVREGRQQAEEKARCVDKQTVDWSNKSFATIRLPEQKTTKYEDCWSSFSDTYTDIVTSEFIEQIEKQTKEQIRINELPRQSTTPTVININPPSPERSTVNQRASTKLAQPRTYRKGYLPSSTILSPTFAFCNRRYLEHSLSKNTEPPKSEKKRAEIMSCKRLAHSTDIAIHWHKYGEHTESVLHINAFSHYAEPRKASYATGTIEKPEKALE